MHLQRRLVSTSEVLSAGEGPEKSDTATGSDSTHGELHLILALPTAAMEMKIRGQPLAYSEYLSLPECWRPT